jgi:transposase-like protein
LISIKQHKNVIKIYTARHIPLLNDKIIALDSKGMSTRDIAVTLPELYGIDPMLTSRLSEQLLEELLQWQ